MYMSRAEKIMSLLPKPGADSEEEENYDPEEELLSRILKENHLREIIDLPPSDNFELALPNLEEFLTMPSIDDLPDNPQIETLPDASENSEQERVVHAPVVTSPAKTPKPKQINERAKIKIFKKVMNGRRSRFYMMWISLRTF